jgi:hypothetical protein
LYGFGEVSSAGISTGAAASDFAPFTAVAAVENEPVDLGVRLAMEKTRRVSVSGAAPKTRLFYALSQM